MTYLDEFVHTYDASMEAQPHGPMMPSEPYFSKIKGQDPMVEKAVGLVMLTDGSTVYNYCNVTNWIPVHVIPHNKCLGFNVH